tara:strand:+ start:605 stop:883 length:279 start_codon:yes stop_codon:yes gene_type:complete
MKTVNSLLAMMMMSAMMDPEFSPGKSSFNTYKPHHKVVLEFNKQEGVLNLIKDYKLIQEGKSKKGSRKQFRIKKQVEDWLEKGWLREIDLTK